MKIGRKIGEGGCSEVFTWENNEKIIKLAKPNTSLLALQREYKNNLVAWEMNLPVPKPFEFVVVNNRPGIVAERIHGETLIDRLYKKFMEQTHSSHREIDWNDIKLSARLLSEIHRLTHSDMPPQREVLMKQILSVNYLNEVEKDIVIDLLNRLPKKSNLCHGDPNPGNMLMRNGELVIIDWMNATIGNPEADLAEYIIMFKYAVLPSNTPPNVVNIFNLLRETIINVFMDEYTHLTGISYKQVEPWIVPIAARKLSGDAISEEEKELLYKEIRHRLKREN